MRAALLACLLLVSGAAGAQEQTVRIGMTAADIPKTVGQPDQGFEGNRFTGNTMYEGLTTWDLSSADKASVVIPGLATEWGVDEADKTIYVVSNADGVKDKVGKRVKLSATFKEDALEAEAVTVIVGAADEE